MRAHYEKIVTCCCFLFLFVNIGFPSSSFGVYQPYIAETLGDTQAMSIMTVRTLVSLATVALVDRYLQALGCRAGVGVATLCTAAGFFVYAMAWTLPVYLIGACLCGFGYSMGGLVGMTLVTRRWYKSGLGTAVGAATVGSGVSAMVVPLVAVRIIEGASLEASLLCEAAFALAVGIAVLALLRNDPAELGRGPADRRPQAAETASEAPRGGIDPADCLGSQVKPGERRLLAVSCIVVGGTCIGCPLYLTSYLIEAGVDPVMAASMLSLEGLSLAIAKFAMGGLFDRIGTRSGSAVGFGFTIAALLCMCLVAPFGLPAAALASVFFGLGLSLGSVGISIWSLEFAKPGMAAKSTKDFQLAYSVGAVLANTFPGPLKELTGSYLPTYLVILALSALAAAIVVGIYVKYRRYPVLR